MTRTSKLRAATALFAFPLALVAACTFSSPYNNTTLEGVSSYEEIRALIPDGSTKDEVRAKLGSPASQSTFGGMSHWSYGTFEADTVGFLFTGMRSKNLTVVFDAHGRVSDLQFSTAGQS